MPSEAERPTVRKKKKGRNPGWQSPMELTARTKKRERNQEEIFAVGRRSSRSSANSTPLPSAPRWPDCAGQPFRVWEASCRGGEASAAKRKARTSAAPATRFSTASGRRGGADGDPLRPTSPGKMSKVRGIRADAFAGRVARRVNSVPSHLGREPSREGKRVRFFAIYGDCVLGELENAGLPPGPPK